MNATSGGVPVPNVGCADRAVAEGDRIAVAVDTSVTTGATAATVAFEAAKTLSNSIKVNQVSVTLKVVLGRRYQLEASENLSTWIPVGGPFVAEDEEIVQDFLVSQTGQNFRIRQLP